MERLEFVLQARISRRPALAAMSCALAVVLGEKCVGGR
jgi:hypothetical protein